MPSEFKTHLIYINTVINRNELEMY